MTASDEAFLKEPSAGRLGAIAANLLRLASATRRPARAALIDPMLEECVRFIEWTAVELPAEAAAELVDLQVMLSLWRRAWPEAQRDQASRTLLSFQAKKWSDRVLASSGLLDGQ